MKRTNDCKQNKKMGDCKLSNRCEDGDLCHVKNCRICGDKIGYLVTEVRQNSYKCFWCSKANTGQD
jgi:hypothetical protein